MHALAEEHVLGALSRGKITVSVLFDAIPRVPHYQMRTYQTIQITLISGIICCSQSNVSLLFILRHAGMRLGKTRSGRKSALECVKNVAD